MQIQTLLERALAWNQATISGQASVIASFLCPVEQVAQWAHSGAVVRRGLSITRHDTGTLTAVIAVQLYGPAGEHCYLSFRCRGKGTPIECKRFGLPTRLLECFPDPPVDLQGLRLLVRLVIEEWFEEEQTREAAE